MKKNILAFTILTVIFSASFIFFKQRNMTPPYPCGPAVNCASLKIETEEELKREISNELTKSVDLNGDGIDEKLALSLSPNSCGTGGCDLQVLQNKNGVDTVVSEISLVRGVYLATATTNGWKDLVIEISGGGAQGGYSKIHFDGKKYPLNAGDGDFVESVNGLEKLIEY